MYRNIFLIFLFIYPILTNAQILKVDKGDLESDSSDYFLGSVQLDFNINNRSATADNDIRFVGFEGNADIVYIADKHAYIFINKINYFKSTGGPLLSTGYTHFRINFLRKKKLSYESFTQVQYDDGRRMPFRFLQGGGVRYRVSADKKAKVYIGIGVMYEKENWRSPIGEELLIEREIWKTSNYINGKFQLNDHVSFNTILYYQGGHDTKSDLFRTRLSGDVVLQMELSGKLAFTVTFAAQYENRPIIPINNLVYSLTNGFKWNF